MANDRDRFRISGKGKEPANTHPEVFYALSVAGHEVSNLCYESIALVFRLLGFNPKSKEDVKRFVEILKTLNDHNAKPWIFSDNPPDADNNNVTIGNAASVDIDDSGLDAELM